MEYRMMALYKNLINLTDRLQTNANIFFFSKPNP